MNGRARHEDPAAEAATPLAARSRWRAVTTALLLLAPGIALLALYARALDYDYAWTDTSAIGGASMLRPAGELAAAFHEPLHRIRDRGEAARQSYYRPLQVVALSWVAERFGSEPRNFRLAGLAAAALCLGAWALFAWKLTGQPAAALFAALFVALHPVGIETCVWIAGTSGAMSALFTIAALALAWASCSARRAPGVAGFAFASLLALSAALLSKERAVVEPALLVALLLSVAHAREVRDPLAPRRAALLVAAHFAVAGVFFFGWRPAVLGSVHVSLPPVGGSAASQITSAVANWPDRLAWLFVPITSSTSDVIRIVPSASDPRVLLGAGLALASAAAWWTCLRRGRPVAALGLAWIWIAYAPTAGLVPMLHANGERYLFLSAFGASLVLADLLGVVKRRAGALAALGAAALPLVFLAQRTSARLPEWESNRTLFEREIARDPAFREGYFLVAAELSRARQFEPAVRHLRTALAEGPEFAGTASYLNPLATHELLCSAELALGHYDQVLELEAQLLRTHPAVARAASLRTCFAQAHNARGRTRHALEIYLGVAAELKNESPPRLYVMIARNHLRLGERREAESWLRRARAAAGADPSLRAQIQRLETRLRQTAGAPGAAPPGTR